MLSAIKLRDFQTHRARKIVFSKGITTIRGPTDVGKSAVLRALRWAALNDLKSGSFIRHGAKDAIVKLLVNGHIITRRRGKKGNVYRLDKRTFRAFGSGVPEAIAKLLSLDKINFQGQFDPHLWFSNSAGEVSRQLNKVIDLSIIDSSLANIAKEVRNAQSRKTVSKERLADLKQQLSQLADQKTRVECFKRIKEAHEELESIKAAGDRLDELLAGAAANQSNRLLQEAVEGEAIVSVFRDFLRTQERTERLGGLIAGYREHRGAAEPPDFEPLAEAFGQHQELTCQMANLEWSINEIEKYQRIVDAAEEQLQNLPQTSICPTCKRPL